MANEKFEAPVDWEKALLDPGSVFMTPEAVIGNAGLTREQKIEILQRWEYDAAEVAVAVEEGMPGDDNDLLGRILSALEQLNGGVDAEHAGPTKQHGLSGRTRRPK